MNHKYIIMALLLGVVYSVFPAQPQTRPSVEYVARNPEKISPKNFWKFQKLVELTQDRVDATLFRQYPQLLNSPASLIITWDVTQRNMAIAPGAKTAWHDVLCLWCNDQRLSVNIPVPNPEDRPYVVTSNTVGSSTHLTDQSSGKRTRAELLKDLRQQRENLHNRNYKK